MEFKVPTYKFTHTFTCTLALISCIALFIGVRAVVAANKKKCRQICLHQVIYVYISLIICWIHHVRCSKWLFGNLLFLCLFMKKSMEGMPLFAWYTSSSVQYTS